MTAADFYAAGYTDLVSVIPPAASLSPGSKISPAILGKVPGKKGKQGWYGYPFQQGGVSPKQIDDWGANVGLMGTRFPGLDIDVEDAKLSKQIQNFALQHFGPSPVRLSREPRALMIYRTDTPFPKMRLSWGDHAVEFLGQGRQFLVAGTHPSGNEYSWVTPPPPADELTTITPESVGAFFDKLQLALEAQGVEVKLSGRTTQAESAASQESLEAPSLEELEKVVAQIDNPASNGWDEMVAMGYAIKAAGGDDAADIFFEWCSRWDGGEYNSDLDTSNWHSFEGPFRAGWDWLCVRAGVNTAQDDFEAVPGAVEPDPMPGSSVDQVPCSDEDVLGRILPGLESKICFIPGDKMWRVWTGHKWERDTTLGHEKVIREALRLQSLYMLALADATPTESEGRALRAAAFRMQSANGIASIVRMSRAFLAKHQTDFDNDTLLLNTPGGVVDLTTGVLTPPDPKRLMSMSTDVSPAPGRPNRWLRFLHDLTGGDLDLQDYLQRMAGYALTGSMSEKKLWFIWGSNSDTGKSTFVNILKGVFGEYEKNVDASAFVSSRQSDGNNFGLAPLHGARLVTATEPPAGQSWDEKRIKAVTGDDEITCRFLRGQFFTYSPTFKIIIVGNHEPEIASVDDAMLNRVNIVPFTIKVPEDRKIADLSQIMLREEGPQILQWMIEGTLSWRAVGLTPPDVVLEKNVDYELSEDVFMTWLAEECDRGEGYEVRRQSLYSSWARWSRARGEDPGGFKAFKRLVDSKKLQGVFDKQLGPRRLQGYLGIRLTTDMDMDIS